MKVVLVCLFFTAVPSSVFTHAMRTTEKRCGKYRFLNETTIECQSCKLCEPGTYVKTRCKRSRDTDCKACPSGYYATTYSRYPGQCRRCKDCGSRLVDKQCTSTSDTVCGNCPLGTYWDYLLNSCTPCSYCFPEFAYEMSIEEACQKTQIPSSHQCTRTTWTPYKPPYLIAKTNDHGDKYFISSNSMTKGESTIPHRLHASESSLQNVGSTIRTTSSLASEKAAEDQTTAMTENNFSIQSACLGSLYSVDCIRVSLFIACVSLAVAVWALYLAYTKRNIQQDTNLLRKPLVKNEV